MGAAGPSFRLATWNILATSYIRPTFYPNSPPRVLDPDWRIPAVVEYAASLNADILCLQEVERPVFDALAKGLAPLGFSGTLALKAGGKPDGCATFLRENFCRLLTERRLVYTDGMDGSPDSGHAAQVFLLDIGGARIALLNTHLKWDAPQTPADHQIGLRQAQIAVEALRQEASTIQMICGDLNVTPDGNLIDFLLEAGFDYTHRTCTSAFTCNSNQKAKLLDYVFFRGQVRAAPEPLLPIDGQTPLPSLDQPSDHLPLIARLAISL